MGCSADVGTSTELDDRLMDEETIDCVVSGCSGAVEIRSTFWFLDDDAEWRTYGSACFCAKHVPYLEQAVDHLPPGRRLMIQRA